MHLRMTGICEAVRGGRTFWAEGVEAAGVEAMGCWRGTAVWQAEPRAAMRT